jgi:hypothetical protein
MRRVLFQDGERVGVLRNCEDYSLKEVDETESRFDPSTLEGASLRRHRRHPIFGPSDCGPFIVPAFGSGRSAEAGAWLKTSSRTIALALNLVPFAGIAFLWFIGVLRDRLGELEDRFFATVFLGSGLLFLAMLFASAALGGGIIIAYAAKPAELLSSPTFTFARAATYEVMNLYAVKMAAVFMISTSTLAIRTGFFARWLAFLGYAFALFLLLSGRYIEWILMLFPMWVLLISIYILIDNLRRPPQAAATSTGS